MLPLNNLRTNVAYIPECSFKVVLYWRAQEIWSCNLMIQAPNAMLKCCIKRDWSTRYAITSWPKWVLYLSLLITLWSIMVYASHSLISTLNPLYFRSTHPKSKTRVWMSLKAIFETTPVLTNQNTYGCSWGPIRRLHWALWGGKMPTETISIKLIE